MANRLVPIGGEADFQQPYVDVSSPYGAGALAPVFVPGGPAPAGNNQPTVGVGDYWWNGTTWDPVWNNAQIAVLASLQDTTAGRTSAFFTNTNANGMIVLLDVTAKTGTGSITNILVQTSMINVAKQRAFVNLVGGPFPISAVGTYAFLIYPGAAAAGVNVQYHLAVNSAVPRSVRVQTVAATDGGGNNITYSAEFCWIVG